MRAPAKAAPSSRAAARGATTSSSTSIGSAPRTEAIRSIVQPAYGAVSSERPSATSMRSHRPIVSMPRSAARSSDRRRRSRTAGSAQRGASGSLGERADLGELALAVEQVVRPDSQQVGNRQGHHPGPPLGGEVAGLELLLVDLDRRHAPEQVPVQRTIGGQRHVRHELHAIAGDPPDRRDELEGGARVLGARRRRARPAPRPTRRSTAPTRRHRRCGPRSRDDEKPSAPDSNASWSSATIVASCASDASWSVASDPWRCDAARSGRPGSRR